MGRLFVSPAENQQFLHRMHRIEGLIHDMEKLPDPAVQAMVREIVQSLLELHGAGLAGILDHLLQAGEPGRALFAVLADDPLIANLLLLHGIHPDDMDTRVRRALEKIRPTLSAGGATVEILAVVEDVVRLRLEASGHGCASSMRSLKQTLAEAILATAPDAAIEIEEQLSTPVAEATFIPVDELTVRLAGGER